MKEVPVVDMGDTLHPWTQMLGEKAGNYRAFVTYMELGPGRSLGKALSAMQEKRGKGRAVRGEGPLSMDRLQKASAQWHWVMRAEAWDMAQMRQRGLAMEAAQRQSAEDEAELVTKGVRLGLLMVQRHLALAEGDPAHVWGARDAREWARDMVTLSRLQRGQPTDIQGVQMVDLRKAMHERLNRLEETARRTAGPGRADPPDEEGPAASEGGPVDPAKDPAAGAKTH